MRNKRGTGLIICGLLLIAAALGLVMFNLGTQRAAGNASKKLLEELTAEMPKEEPAPGSALTQAHMPEEYIPDYILNPRMDMPVKQIDGSCYIGTLEIPALNISLPVAEEWNYDNLKTSPCRYTGSVYMGDMVICAHNYDIHFGSIKYLSYEDTVIFTDMDGNRFEYAVIEVETLEPEEIDEMIYRDGWDLTLFTCTVGGATRVTVRCKLV